MKKLYLSLIGFLSVIIFALTACAQQDVETITMSGDFIVFEDIDGLYEWSSYVVRAEILDERVEWIDPQLTTDDPFFIPMVINRIKILEVFSGDLEAESVLEIWQSGSGEYGNIQFITEDKTSLFVGSELILFLSRDTFAPPGTPLSITSRLQGAYYSVNQFAINAQGLLQEDFSIMQSFNEDMLEANITLSSVNENNQLTLTIGDLIRISNAN